ncbi:MAG TPA: LLM class flavin-dependent oxidoreductase [Caulobacteraceae bacterium]|nr:LLM class flavin-dependent oxidoreductase [Caulobacteraceae bacterium]
MKAAIFTPCAYHGPAEGSGWPTSARVYSDEAAAETFQTALAQARLADEVGFDWVTVAEHHFAPFCMTPNPMVLAGALTQAVKRAKIALLGADIPILNPIRVAEEFAMLDAMSGGRVVAGMLRGTPNEYITYNINPAESRGRFEEALQLIKMAWTEPEPFGWQGRYYQYKTISIWPRPVQKPHPPIYMSGSSPESGEFAARNRVGLGFAVTTLPLASKASRHYRDKAAEIGWTPTGDDIIYRVGCHVADTDEQALEDLNLATAPRNPALSLSLTRSTDDAITDAGYYGRDEVQRRRVAMAFSGDLNSRIDNGQILIGSPTTVAEQIRHIHAETGAGVLDLIPGPPRGDKALKSIELIGTKVMPLVRELN